MIYGFKSLYNLDYIMKGKFLIILLIFPFVLMGGDREEDRIVVEELTLYKIEGKTLYFKELKIPFPITESFEELLKRKKIIYDEKIKNPEFKLPARVEICYELPIITEEGYLPVKVIYIEYLEYVGEFKEKE